MAIKRFTAETWDEALRQVKEEYGDDAVILHSKTYKNGGMMGLGNRPVVEITASDDPAMAKAKGSAPSNNKEENITEDSATRQNYSRMLEKAYAVAATRSDAEGGADGDAGKGPAASLELSSQTSDNAKASLFRQSKVAAKEKGGNDAEIAALMRDISELKALVSSLATDSTNVAIGEMSQVVQEIHARLLEHAVSPELAKNIAHLISRQLSGEQLDNKDIVECAAVEIISEMIPVSGPLQLSATKTNVVALVGPTGVGKTTTLSKLAANLKIAEGSRVGFITIDTYRLGATEQLKTLASILDVPVRIVMNPGEIRTAIKEMSNLDVIFIDTAGRSQHDRMRMNELKAFLDAATPDETHLVITATTHPAHLMSILDHFGSMAVDRLILTKLDEAATFGPVLDIIMKAGKPLSYLTVGQDIPDDIELASNQRMARLLLGVDHVD